MALLVAKLIKRNNHGGNLYLYSMKLIIPLSLLAMGGVNQAVVLAR